MCNWYGIPGRFCGQNCSREDASKLLQARQNQSGRLGQDPTKNQADKGFFCGINSHVTWALT